MKAIRNIIFITNSHKDKSLPLAQSLAAIASSNNVKSRIQDFSEIGENSFKDCDACCVLGGDGTLLKCVNEAVRLDIPIFGINFGKLGFLTTFKDTINDADFLLILKGNYQISERSLLSLSLDGKDFLALNDIVLKQKDSRGMYETIVYANGEYLADYSADGIIIATPTGSTAYNLSAGGPLLTPKLSAYVLTPICPHALANRSIIFDSSAEIEVLSPTQAGEIFIDGQKMLNLNPEEKVLIKSSERKIKFIRAVGHSHFNLLRNKLGWAENPRGNKSL